jgi:hypothetical protein
MSEIAATGWLLVVGPVLFLVGAGNPRLVTVWTAPRDRFLAVVHERPRAWRFTNVLFLAATVVTAAGLDVLPVLLPDPGARLLAAAGSATFSFAAVLWAVSLVYRLAVVPTVPGRFADIGAIDPAAQFAEQWAGGLFAAFIVIGAAGLGAIGLAIAIGGPIVAVLGAATSLFALLLLAGFLVAGDMPPFTLYLPPLAIGLAILLGAH